MLQLNLQKLQRKSKHKNLITSVMGEDLWLLPNKAIYWPTQKAILISDLHLGKVDHFRKHGIGLPAQAALANYKQLECVLVEYSPLVVYILGDLFHSDHNHDWDRFVTFRQQFDKTRFVLIQGNHDVLDRSMFDNALDHIASELIVGPFLLTHHPYRDSGHYNLCGHIHPAVILEGKARQSLRLPCFYFSHDIGILPAFGSFTGMHALECGNADRVYVIAEDEVMPYFV